MAAPTFLYRFRGLSAETIEHEVCALEESYLYSPPFKAMNDPMEAFYEFGGEDDLLDDAILAVRGRSVQGAYNIIKETIDKFALISFADTHESLPLWAYYANNFAGMCLEFSTKRLAIGDLRGNELAPVVYSRDALPPICLGNPGSGWIKEEILPRMTRKRIEWAHEREWRYVTGEVGPKHYLDDALKRIYLGPRIEDDHASRVCRAVKGRPVEVLRGHTAGFELEFETVQTATPLADCERVGAGRFARTDAFSAEAELKAFFGDRYDAFVAECQSLTENPNLEDVWDAAISAKCNSVVRVKTKYKLRDGSVIDNDSYFDRDINSVPDLINI